MHSQKPIDINLISYYIIRQQQYGDRVDRPLYSDALKATTHPAAMTRSSAEGSPNNHYMRSFSPLAGSRDDDLSHFMLQWSQPAQGDQGYSGIRAFSHENGHPYKAAPVENGHFDRNVIAVGMKGDGNQTFTALVGSLSQQRGQYYLDEPAERDANQGTKSYQIPHQDGKAPHFQNAFAPSPQQQYPPYNGFLSQPGRDVSPFPMSAAPEQSYAIDDVQRLRLQVPGWQCPTEMGEHGQGARVPNFEEPSLQKADSLGAVSGINLTINVPSKTGIDRWNGGNNLEIATPCIEKESGFHCGGALSSTTDRISPATSWESINSAFSREPGSAFSPSSEGISSDMSDYTDSEWKPFGDMFASTPVRATQVMGVKKALDEDFDVRSETDDTIAETVTILPVAVESTCVQKAVNVEEYCEVKEDNR